MNKIQEDKSELASLREGRETIIGRAAGLLNQNNRELTTLSAELDQLDEALSFRTIKAPISGTVFNLRAARYSVVGNDQVLLKLVPSNELQAKVAISNSDIGFLRPGLPATVSVDSFPSGEFGYIQGNLVSIGSDALPPDQESRVSRFPAMIKLKQQKVESGGKLLNLQSGMSITANIKLRSRPVITLVTDMFTKQVDGLKRFR